MRYLLIVIISVFTVSASHGQSRQADSAGLTVNVVGHNNICVGDSTGLHPFVTNGSGHYTYLWSTGDTTENIGVATAGIYSVTVTDSLSTATGSITVRQDSVVVPMVTIAPGGNYWPYGVSSNHTFCIMLGVKRASTNASYFVATATNGGNNPQFRWRMNGVLSSEVSDTFVIARDNNGNFEIDSAVRAAWQQNNYTILLSCEVISSIACARPDTAVSLIDTVYQSCGGGIYDISIDSDVHILPNPSNGQFSLSIEKQSHEISMELRNLQGALLYHEQQRGVGLFKKEFNFSNLANGLYLLKVSTENGVAVKRIVVQ